ncbi:alpha/beta hydrolase fold domain-containing protein [Massilia niabensis]|uniref:Alpha/beta hydrolase fold domain-containing protein n=1 Tax=Massilia niabensis TaxID=544910 RepID=A0ABW0LDK0_9BURK
MRAQLPSLTGVLLALGLAAPLAVQAAGCVEPAPDPNNTYDAERTYSKQVRRYPFIHIASAAVPSNVRVVRDQTYVRYGSRCLKLDLYLPAQAPRGGTPVVVLVHGGGWNAGYRSEFVPMALRLAQRGYAAATISYRLAGEAGYPAAVDDTRAAVRWVRRHAERHGIDPQRIALAGGSAGAQVAGLAALTADLHGFDPHARDGTVSSAVQAIVNVDGTVDFTTEESRRHDNEPGKPPSPAAVWLGGRYAEKRAVWHAASPINYVRRGMPPILFIGSSQARFQSGRDEMVTRMAARGAVARVVLLPDTPHSFWLFDPWLQPTVDATVGFLDENLGR